MAEIENTQINLATTSKTDPEVSQDSNTTKTTSTVASFNKEPTLISSSSSLQCRYFKLQYKPSLQPAI